LSSTLPFFSNNLSDLCELFESKETLIKAAERARGMMTGRDMSRMTLKGKRNWRKGERWCLLIASAMYLRKKKDAGVAGVSGLV
jgi:hypothetical protein